MPSSSLFEIEGEVDVGVEVGAEVNSDLIYGRSSSCLRSLYNR